MATANYVLFVSMPWCVVHSCVCGCVCACVQGLLGDTLTSRLGLHDEAESLLRETFEGGSKALGHCAWPTMDACGVLYKLLYRTTNRVDEARAFMERVEKMGLFHPWVEGQRCSFDFMS